MTRDCYCRAEVPYQWREAVDELIPNVLAQRWASSQTKTIWSPLRKTQLLRDLWITVLEFQERHGVKTPPGAVEAYMRERDNINLERIDELDRQLRHDIMANVHAFNEVAGFQCIHEGLTSRDETDNVEQACILESLVLMRNKTVAILKRLDDQQEQFPGIIITGRSHFVAGQATTYGKRLATIAEELMFALQHLNELIERYPLRGIKGAMGTQQDMQDVLDGDDSALDELDELVATKFGFANIFDSTGQIYPRSLDAEAIDVLCQLAAPCSSFATQLRLMAGLGLAQEGRKTNQKGSSAMPHKRNARTSERVIGLRRALNGYKVMAADNAGEQWFEGDVSCSAVRRIIFPDAFFALDGIYEAMLTVLREMTIFPKLIERELGTYAPFLSSTAFLMAAVAAEMGRETAYNIIQRHAMSAIAVIDEGGEGQFVDTLLQDPDFKVPAVIIRDIVSHPKTGRAATQTMKVFEDAEDWMKLYPDMLNYEPEPLH